MATVTRFVYPGDDPHHAVRLPVLDGQVVADDSAIPSFSSLRDLVYIGDIFADITAFTGTSVKADIFFFVCGPITSLPGRR